MAGNGALPLLLPLWLCTLLAIYALFAICYLHLIKSVCA